MRYFIRWFLQKVVSCRWVQYLGPGVWPVISSYFLTRTRNILVTSNCIAGVPLTVFSAILRRWRIAFTSPWLFSFFACLTACAPGTPGPIASINWWKWNKKRISKILLLQFFLLISEIFESFHIFSFAEKNEICFGYANDAATGNDPQLVSGNWWSLCHKKIEMDGPRNLGSTEIFQPSWMRTSQIKNLTE